MLLVNGLYSSDDLLDITLCNSYYSVCFADCSHPMIIQTNKKQKQ